MPMATRDEQRAYQREWKARRRAEWIAAHGPCARCGSDLDMEVDHIDPSDKLYNPSIIWSWSRERRDAELAKCQVLCGECHQKKTNEERHRTSHGTGQMYQAYRCRCDLCRAWKIQECREYKARKKLRSVNRSGTGPVC